MAKCMGFTTFFSKFICDRINSISFVDFYDDSIEKCL
jgi:hypothetical protein